MGTTCPGWCLQPRSPITAQSPGVSGMAQGSREGFQAHQAPDWAAYSYKSLENIISPAARGHSPPASQSGCSLV